MTSAVRKDSDSSSCAQPIRIAAVSYLNARPLICGLDSQPNCQLQADVPAKLIDLLRDNRTDVALLPVIDYQRLDNLCIVPSGGIGCDGETLTVRIFSRVPISEIRTLACDSESHTSVVLAKILLAEQFATHPEFMALASASTRQSADAMLLIGDKVVCEEPTGYEHQLDLGAAWKNLTGLPFVFAVWTARQGIDLGDLPRQLEQARRDGLANADDLVRQYAIPRGWPPAIARQYLTINLQYEIAEPQLAAIGHFHSLAAKHGLIPAAQPLRIYSPPENS